MSELRHPAHSNEPRDHQDHGDYHSERHGRRGHHEDRIFYFGTHKLEAPAKQMKVRTLKDFIRQHVEGFNVEHTLVQEECGDRPDKPLSDDDEVRICDFPHFYDQPPANFGSR